MTNNFTRLAIVANLLITSVCCAQRVADLPSRPAKGEVENVYIEKIADDSLATAFEIWIQGGVKYHFHEHHTECVYILQGDGEMVLGEETMHVKAGDFVMIPKGTPHSVMAINRMKVLSVQTPQWTTEDRKFIEPVRRPHNE
ncbi:MAG: cupin domain-containing protein [Flavobacteriales bacterium]|nr:cupin domain-containing protein [Flavobacteriales bacterium]